MENMTRLALRILIVSVALSGVVGVMAILGGGGPLQGRILGTTTTISLASLCCLACAALWERKQSIALPFSGIGFTLIGASLVIGGIWIDYYSEPFLKLTAIIIVLAMVSSHLSLLSMANLSGNYRLGLTSAFVVDYALALLISVMLFEPHPSDFLFKCLGVLSVAVASISILIPIFHRLSANVSREDAPQTALKVRCPHCGAMFQLEASEGGGISHERT